MGGHCHVLTFINLKKAYDFVPRKAMSLALDKLGVTDEIVLLIHSFYEGMKAEIHLGRCLLDQFDVRNGLMQSFCMALVLFYLFACLVKEHLHVRVEEAKVCKHLTKV